jgi:hypothetical protein
MLQTSYLTQKLQITSVTNTSVILYDVSTNKFCHLLEDEASYGFSSIEVTNQSWSQQMVRYVRERESYKVAATRTFMHCNAKKIMQLVVLLSVDIFITVITLFIVVYLFQLDFPLLCISVSTPYLNNVMCQLSVLTRGSEQYQY